MNRFFFLASFLACFNWVVLAVNDSKSLIFGASYTGDVVRNFKGGLQTGSVYLGLATVEASFDVEKAGWWKGTDVLVKLANTHGGDPSNKLVGDFQGVSNIEAENLTYFYELWVRHNWKNITFTLGLQDLNVNFASCEKLGLFMNSSFGIHSSIADNVNSPLFPLTGLGFDLFWEITKRTSLRMAVYDGTPDEFESNPYNLKWKLGSNQGMLFVSEFVTGNPLSSGREYCFKAGAYLHKHNSIYNDHTENYGFYFLANLEILKNLHFLSQIGISPKHINRHNHYYSLGLKKNNAFSSRPNDEWGVAVAYAHIDENVAGCETVLEMTYRLQLNEHFYLQPDFQYIINPAGTDQKIPNAWVGFLRFGLEL